MAAEEVVGGIVGFLRLDADEFHREITRAIAEVKVLKGMDAKVDIKVTGASKLESELLRAKRAAEGASDGVSGLSRQMGSLGTPGLVVGGIVAGMALLGPVTGAATAAMAGFVGVAGTAALAYVGFKKEVEAGTALGMAMQSQVDELKGAFQALGATAAGAMSADVLGGLSELRDFLPTLNDEVGLLATHLGRAFRTSMTGLLSGLTNMMPLLQDGGVYAEQLAQKFAEFTQSQDFKDFIAYAREKLPEVVAAIASLGEGIKDLTVAMAPAGDALVEIINLTGKFASGTATVIGWLGKLNDATAFPGMDQETTMARISGDAEKVAPTVADATVKMQAFAAIQTPLASGLGTTDQALQRVSEKQRATATTASDATLAMQLQGDAAGLLKQALDGLNGTNVSFAQAQNSFDSSLANMGDHITKTGKKVKFTTTSIDNMSTASVALRGQLNGQVTSAMSAAEQYAQLTGSTEKGRKKLAEMRDQIIKNATAHGVDKDAVTKYIDKLLKIPKKVPPTKLEVATATALSGIKAFQAAIDKLHGKKVTAQVRYVYTGRLPNGGRSTAGGQVMDAGAKGGLISHGIKRFDKGGLIKGPGTGTSDSIMGQIAGSGEPIRVANGEFLSTAASQRRNRAALAAGNRGATLAVAGAGGPTTFHETTHSPVIIHNATFTDGADLRRRADQASAFRQSTGAGAL